LLFFFFLDGQFSSACRYMSLSSNYIDIDDKCDVYPTIFFKLSTGVLQLLVGPFNLKEVRIYSFLNINSSL
jgi:hypothetical protein